jgi:diguanylate cyclase (GGDEF)-like protein
MKTNEKGKTTMKAFNTDDYHRLYDVLELGVCIVAQDADEAILFANRGVLNFYGCPSEAAFLDLTGGQFSGMQINRALSLAAVAGDQQHFTLHFSFMTMHRHIREADATITRTVLQGCPVYIVQMVSYQMLADENAPDRITGFFAPQAFFQKAQDMAKLNLEQGVFTDYCPVCFNVTNFRGFNHSNGVKEGDQALAFIAKTLHGHFPDGLFGHISADTFYALLPRADLTLKVDEVCAAVNRFLGSPDCTLKAGIVVYDQLVSMAELRHSFDMAKLACDEAKKNPEQAYVIFRKEIQERVEKRAYILETFDQALTDGRIKVFFQPVIRLLSGKICSLKATAHWDDPALGTIAPEVFWPVLDEARLSGRLDLFVIDRVIRRQYERKQSGHTLLPVTLHLSRLGLTLMNPLEHLEAAIQRCRLSRSCVRISLSEDVLNDSTGFFFREIRAFQDAGYEIWLDHLDLDYLSNAELYESRFNLVELGREFLDHLDERGRTIITDIARMAKHIGVHVLVDGVATAEQVDFLKSVGCGKIAGPYCGKPVVYSELTAALRQQGVETENNLEQSVYRAAELVDIASERPLCLFLVDHGEIRMLTMNEACLAEAAKAGLPREAAWAFFFKERQQTFSTRFTQAVEKTYHDGKNLIRFVVKKQVMQLTTSRIAGVPDFWVGGAELVHIASNYANREHLQFDHLVHSAAAISDHVFYLDTAKDQIEVVASVGPRFAVGQTFHGIAGILDAFCRQYVHADDQKRFKAAADIEALKRRVQQSAYGRVEVLFRVRQSDGAYHWIVCRVVLVSDDDVESLMIYEWQDVWENLPDGEARLTRTGAVHSEIRKDHLFESVLRYSGLPFYWKDAAHRYAGASEAFLELIGQRSEAEVMGKTAAALNVYTDADKVEQVERQVMDDGRTVVTEKRHLLTGGKEKIYCETVFPYYGDREIEGVAGWLRPENETAANRDTLTGLMDAAGLLSVGFALDDILRKGGEDYGAVLLAIRNYDSLYKTFGQDFAEKAEKTVARQIEAEGLPGGVASARVRSGCFILLGRGRVMRQVEAASIRIQDQIQDLRAIDGLPCHIELNRAVASGAEASGFFNLISLLAQRTEHWYKLNDTFFSDVWEEAGIDTDTLDQAPAPVYIVDPETWQLLFANKAMKQMSGLPDDYDCLGRKCYELAGRTQPCADCGMTRTSEQLFDVYEKQWRDDDQTVYKVRNLRVLWRGRHARLVVCEPLNAARASARERDAILRAERWGNEAIAIALGEADPEVGIQKSIAFVAQHLHAERFMIFEERGSRELTCSFEWKEQGFLPIQNDLQSVPKPRFAALYGEFEKEKLVRAPDYAAFQRQHPDFSLPVTGARNLLAGQLFQAGQPVGFTLLINLSAESFEPAGYMLDTLTDFFAAMMRIRSNLSQADEQGRRDHMTGVLNRRGFRHYLEETRFVGPRVILSCDIDGLKDVNDNQGHEAGDRLIRSASDILVRHSDKDRVFRMGGDEFLVIREGMDEGGARQLVQAIKHAARRAGFGVSIGYVVHHGRIDDADAVLRHADHAMYADKGRSRRRRRTDPKG